MQNSLTNIDVFILCGGLGKRLRKISGNTPKPMVRIGEYVFLDILIKYMAGFGFRRFILGTGYKADVIEDYYKTNKISDLDILFSREEVLLDTGGAVKNAKDLIRSNPFFVLNGDSLCKFNPTAFLNFHRKKKSLITILLKKIPNGKEYGEIKLGTSSRIVSFREKNDKVKECFINAGVYIFGKNIFKLMPNLSKFSLERDFFPAIAGKRIFGYPFSSFFIDIGMPSRYLEARKIFLGNK